MIKYFIYISLFLLLFLTNSVALKIGIKTVTTYNTTLLLFTFLILILSKDMKVILSNSKTELFGILLCIYIFLWKYFLNQFEQIKSSLTFLFIPIILSLVLENYNINFRKSIKNLLIFFFLIETSLGIVESLFNFNLFPTIYEQNLYLEGVKGEFRSESLLGHPLNNALCVSIMSSYILIDYSSIYKKIFFVSLGFFSILSFNARAASIIFTLILVIYLINNFKNKLNLRSLIVTLIIFFSSTLLFYFLNTNYGIGGRLFNSEILDGSSKTRIDVINAFKFINSTVFWFGDSSNYIYVTNKLGAGGVENSLIVLLINYGLIISVLILIFFIFFFRKKIKNLSNVDSLIIFLSFIVLGSTNNGLVSVDPFIFFILFSHSFSNK